jgi:Ax21 family sulfation-dependent quorum factor
MKRTLLALTLLAAVPFAASAAEGVSYNYVQGGYSAINGNGGADAKGFGFDGSVAVHPKFHVFAGYNKQEIDDTNIDLDQWRIGAGFNHALTSKADLVTRVAYEKADFGSVTGLNIGSGIDGYSAEVGMRGAMTNHLEGYVMAGYEDYEGYEGDVYGRVGAQVKFNENWGINGDVKFADGDTQWFVGPRFSW